MPSWLFTFMKLVCGRLAQDWQQHFGHPVLALHAFVDPQRFRGTYFWFFLKANQPLALAKAGQLPPGDVRPSGQQLGQGPRAD